jgi:hypothetical protein
MISFLLHLLTMLSKALLLPVLALSLIHQIDAYWTVTEKTTVQPGKKFWAELSEIHFDGNSTSIQCTVDIQPAQDLQTITYEGHSGYVGCTGGSLVSLYGENRTLKYLTQSQSRQRLNCVLVEHTNRYKEYVCGNAVPKYAEPSAITGTASSASHSHSVSVPTIIYEETCILGYMDTLEGQGPNGACCSHSDDCLDTCVRGVCGIAP